MNYRQFFAFVLALSTFSFLGIACASLPKGEITQSSGTVVLVSRDELKARFGKNATVNPFLEPIGMVQGQHDEFVVLQLHLELSEKSRVAVGADVTAPDGTAVAFLKPYDEFTNYWSLWEQMGDAGRRADRIFDNCLPMASEVMGKGRRDYLLVLVGKNPLPRPSVVRVDLIIGDQAPKSWEFDLPPAAKK